MARKPLRTGFTTGACAAAAALGAARMLKEQRRIEAVELLLPAGVAATFRLEGQAFDAEKASCFVVKDAGDDPDVTHGVEVHAEVKLNPPSPRPSPTRGEGEKEIPPHLMGGGEGGLTVVIEGGTGIGKVTKPGLAVPVGEWAINPVPRRMITVGVREIFPPHATQLSPHVTISIPDGEERAKRTLNARLGIVGGLSILGTSGIVRPISHQAWTDTLDAAFDVALAGGCDTVVLSTGRTSELAAQKELLESAKGKGLGAKGSQNLLPLAISPSPESSGPLPEEAFIMMGDHVGYALAACHRRGFPQLVLAAQFAKLVKIACGHAQTHVSASRLELGQLAAWCRASGLDEVLAKTIECANTAREVYLAAADPGALAAVVAARALAQMRIWAPGAALAVFLVDYNGTTAGCYGDWPGRAESS
jgi:cobalt-precorrin-5B (C1)-methyltransferase